MRTLAVQRDDRELLRIAATEAATVLRHGGVVLMPTETVYGLAALASSEAAIEKLRHLTGRTAARVFTLHLPSTKAMAAYVGPLPGEPARLISKALPGPITLAITLEHTEAERYASALSLTAATRQRLYDSGTISVRVPDDAIAQAVLSAPGLDPGKTLGDGAGTGAMQIVAMAAGRGSGPLPTHADRVVRELGDGIDLVLDAGPTRHGKPSTLVSVKRESAGERRWRVNVERAGVYDERMIRKLTRWTMLLVCSGNTCRSPMAEGLARAMLAKQWNVRGDELENLGLRVISAGAATAPGAPASREAVALLNQRGIDLSAHRSRMLSVEMIHEADVVFGMTRAHVEAALGLTPAARGKAWLLDEQGEIEDPIGSGAEAYRRTAEQIERALRQRLKEHGP